jgi:hypothetical protein
MDNLKPIEGRVEDGQYVGRYADYQSNHERLVSEYSDRDSASTVGAGIALLGLVVIAGISVYETIVWIFG